MLFVQDTRGYRQVEADELKQMLTEAFIEVSSATSYTNGYLMHGTSCDSSQDARFRIAFVNKAESQFIDEHRKEILQRAAELIAADIRSLEK